MLQFQAGDLHSLSLVGSGGFGLVYRGWSETLGMEVALKMIQGARERNLKDFMKERDMMHTANYTYVLRLLGVYEKPEGNLIEYGLVMEYMPLGSLCTLFENVPDVPWALRFQILHQVVLGMNFLHSLSHPIIHRDLKPGNVLFNKYLDVQLTDFGLAKFAGASSTMPTDQSIVGTLAYMPPEALNDLNYKPTKLFDVYSFGILTWSVLSGQKPYPDLKVETALMNNEYVGEIDSAIREVLDLLKNPYASAQTSGVVEPSEDTDTSSLVPNFTDLFGNNAEVHELQEAAGGGELVPVQTSPEEQDVDDESLEESDEELSSPSDVLSRSITSVIKESLGDQNVLGNLCAKGFISTADQGNLESSRNLGEFINATARIIRPQQDKIKSFFEKLNL
ncbi:receptor-interacting serine/threonine-protein kinase 4-like isoform X3 [Ascaphus truei]|uniref:receptor-interacting serine/threonine-protein kinase 4-like isoform X3 n=1 Tax=Ascaphus truei TaxID=8439 RepID=UPI003F59A967